MKSLSLCSGLDDVDVLAPDGLVYLDHGFPVGLVVDAAAAQSDVEVARDRVRQVGVGGAREDDHAALVHPGKNLSMVFSMATCTLSELYGGNTHRASGQVKVRRN